ncbi:cation transporter [Leptothoe sp. ISB3NOV94-8A]
MHIHILDQWKHSHDFSNDQGRAEKNTKVVMLFTAVTMVAEIVAGTIFGSMALLADGWHMATHVAAFGITIFAYQYNMPETIPPTLNTPLVQERPVCLAVLPVSLPLLSSLYRGFNPECYEIN